MKLLLTIFVLLVLMSGNALAELEALQVAAGSDDAGTTTSGWLLGNAFTQMGLRGALVGEGGWRFNSVGIAQGATIDACTLEIHTDVDFEASVTFTCEDTSDAATFSNETDFDNRIRTSASVNHTLAITSGNVFLIIDVELKTIVQEVINRGDWSLDNDLVVFHIDNGSAFDEWKHYQTYEHDPSEAAKLRIYFTVSGVAGQVIMIYSD